MSDFIELTKAFFLSGLQVNRRRQNQKSSFQSLAILGLVFLFLSFYYNYTFIQSLGALGISYENYLLMILACDTVFILSTSIAQMQGTIFKTKDYEFLESLPVSKKTIVAAKIASVYIIGVLEDLIISLPALILYLAYTKNFYIGFLFLIAIFFVEMIPLLVSTLIGTLIALMTAKVKHSNIFTFILYFLFIGLVFIFSFTISSGYGSQLMKVVNVIPYLRFVEKAFTISTWYYYLLFLAINIVSCVVVIFLVSLVYRPLNVMTNRKQFASKYVSVNKIDLDQEKTLLKKEKDMLLKNSKYFTNSFLGPIFGLLISVMFIIMGQQGGVDEAGIDETSIMLSMVPTMLLLFNSMMASTTSSISLEFKNFEMLLAYPIEPKDIIKNKLKVGLMIPIIMNLIASTIIAILTCIFTSFNLILIIEIYLFPLLACVLTAVVGMYFGIKYPQLHFENEMQALKNSKASIRTLLCITLPTMILMSLLMVVSIICFNNVLIGSIVIAAVTGIYVLAICLSWSALKRKGPEMFAQIIEK